MDRFSSKILTFFYLFVFCVYPIILFLFLLLLFLTFCTTYMFKRKMNVARKRLEIFSNLIDIKDRIVVF